MSAATNSPHVHVDVGQAYESLFEPLEKQRDSVKVFDGNRGSAKTRSILTALMVRALKYPGSSWALWRSRRTRLTETVMKTFEEQVLPAFGMRVPHVQNRTRYTLPNGSVFLPIGLDDIYRNTSAEFSGGYLNEGIELPTLDSVQALLGSLREAKVPFNQLLIDTNPGHPGHWLNQRAEPVSKAIRKLPSNRAEYDKIQEHNRRPAPEGKWKRIICGHEDNPGYFILKKWELTPLGKRYIKDTLEGLTGSLRRRWMFREWVAATGTVYANFDEERHAIKPFKVPSDWPIYWGYDAGMDHPTAILWFTVSPPGELYPKGRIYIIGEHVLSGRGVKNTIDPETKAVLERGHASYVGEIESANSWHPRWRYGDPQHVFSKTAQSPRSLSEQWRDCGYQLTPWPLTKGNEETMVEAVRSRLDDGSFVVFNSCRHTIMGFQSWCYKRTVGGEMMGGKDKFEDRNNDEMDVVKGVIATNPVYEQQQTRVETGHSGEEGDYSASRISKERLITVKGKRVRLRMEEEEEE